MRKYVYLAIIVSMLSITTCFAASNYSYTENPVTLQNNNAVGIPQQQMFADRGTLRGSVVTVPAGQNIKAVVTSPLSSETMYRGQNVSVILGTDFYYNGMQIAPAGSTVTGVVLDVSKAKHGSMNGKLAIRFTNIVTPEGAQIPISAVIKTDDNTGVLVGGTAVDVTKEYSKDLAVGAGAGAVTGVVMSAIGGGNIGKTAALGTAIGAGGGLVKSIWDKGNDVEIPTNANIDLYLTQPITVVPAGR